MDVGTVMLRREREGEDGHLMFKMLIKPTLYYKILLLLILTVLDVLNVYMTAFSTKPNEHQIYYYFV